MTPEDAEADARIGELAVSEVDAALEHLERARLLFAVVEGDSESMATIHDLLAVEAAARSAVTRFESPRLWLVPDGLDGKD